MLGYYIPTRECIAKENVAEFFTGRNGYIYEIENLNYIDVNAKFGELTNFIEQSEFSIPGGVKPEEIKGGCVYESGVNTGQYISNPNFKGGN